MDTTDVGISGADGYFAMHVFGVPDEPVNQWTVDVDPYGLRGCKDAVPADDVGADGVSQRVGPESALASGGSEPTPKTSPPSQDQARQ